MRTMADHLSRKRRIAAAVASALLAVAGLGGCGDDTKQHVTFEENEDGNVGFATIAELASISHVVAVFQILEPVKEPIVVGSEPGSDEADSRVEITVYRAKVIEVLFNLESYYPIETGGEALVGISTGGDGMKALQPGSTVLGFMASLETIGHPEALGFVRSQFGLFSVLDPARLSESPLAYGGSAIDGPATVGELSAQIRDGRLPVGTVILEMVKSGQIVPGGGRPEEPSTETIPDGQSVEPTIAPEE